MIGIGNLTLCTILDNGTGLFWGQRNYDPEFRLVQHRAHRNCNVWPSPVLYCQVLILAIVSSRGNIYEQHTGPGDPDVTSAIRINRVRRPRARRYNVVAVSYSLSLFVGCFSKKGLFNFRRLFLFEVAF